MATELEKLTNIFYLSRLVNLKKCKHGLKLKVSSLFLSTCKSNKKNRKKAT